MAQWSIMASIPARTSKPRRNRALSQSTFHAALRWSLYCDVPGGRERHCGGLGRPTYQHQELARESSTDCLPNKIDSRANALDYESHYQVHLVGGDGVGNGLRSWDGVHRPLCPYPSTRLAVVDWTGDSTVVRAE